MAAGIRWAKEGGCLVPASKGECSCPSSDGDATVLLDSGLASHACLDMDDVSRITGLGEVQFNMFSSVTDWLQNGNCFRNDGYMTSLPKLSGLADELLIASDSATRPGAAGCQEASWSLLGEAAFNGS